MNGEEFREGTARALAAAGFPALAEEVTATPGPQQPDEGLTGQAFCAVCRTRCGSCGCRMGGCYTEAWWAAQGRPSRPAAPSAQPAYPEPGWLLPTAQPVRDTGEGRR